MPNSEFSSASDSANIKIDPSINSVDVWTGTEASVRDLRETITNLKELKDDVDRCEAWDRDIQRLLETKDNKCIIALYGETGVGKSSLLNAILDADIVPTSAFRACTSFVTEVSYHKRKVFEGQIEIYTEQELRKEIEYSKGDLEMDGSGDSPAPDSETGSPRGDPEEAAEISRAKISALYPGLSPEDFLETSVDDLIGMIPEKLLGKKLLIEASEPDEFTSKLQRYIDSSRARSTIPAKRRAPGSDTSESIALWPIVRKVAIKCNSRALSTGAILVDLPGVADANRARASVAEKYKDEATYVWIVTRIQRAADSAFVRDTLHSSIGRRLRMDGRFHPDTITVIATQTDDVGVLSNPSSAFGLQDDPEIQELEEERRDLTKELKTMSLSQSHKLSSIKNLTSAPTGGGKAKSDDRTKARRKIQDIDDAISEKCSLQRSEDCKVLLQDRFREVIQTLRPHPSQLDKSAELAIYTVSAKRYEELGYADPVELQSTGIPQLQHRCHDLVRKQNKAATILYLDALDCLLREVQLYCQSHPPSTFNGDSAALKERWASSGKGNVMSVDDGVEADERPANIKEYLSAHLTPIITEVTRELKNNAADLDEHGRRAATQASERAKSSLEAVIPPRIHWQTFRAMLRRHGHFKHINVDDTLLACFQERVIDHLTVSFTEDRIGQRINEEFMTCIERLHVEIISSLPSNSPLTKKLKKRTENSRKAALTYLKGQISQMTNAVKTARGEIDRALKARMEKELRPGYDGTQGDLFRGRGSVRRQKVAFSGYFDGHRHEIFDALVDEMMKRRRAINSKVILARLPKLVTYLSNRVDLIMSTLWKTVSEDPKILQARKQAYMSCRRVRGVMEQWREAQKHRERMIRLGDSPSLEDMTLVKQEHVEAGLESEDELALQYPEDELDSDVEKLDSE